MSCRLFISLVFCFLLFGIFGFVHGGQEEISKVSVFVLGNLGTGISSSFDIEVRDAITGSVVRRAAEKRSSDVLEIPYGVYFIEVYAQGFEPYVVRIQISRPETWIPVGLTVGSLGAPVTPGSVSGKVTEYSKTPVWLKLVGLYSDFIAHTAADSSGGFRFREIRPGKYLLLIFQRGELLESKVLEVRNAEQVTIR